MGLSFQLEMNLYTNESFLDMTYVVIYARLIAVRLYKKSQNYLQKNNLYLSLTPGLWRR